jgi:pimeloyl-ACP methyl ester carboxylesterase
MPRLWLLPLFAAALALLLLLSLGIAGIGFGLWRPWLDAFEALPKPPATPIVNMDHGWSEGDRVMRRVVLDAGDAGQAGLTVSLPYPLPDRPMPVVLVLGGLATGEANLRQIRNAGDNVVVGYDWPISARLPSGLEMLQVAPELHRRVLSAPGQIAAAIAWATAQPWADPGRVSLLGFSLGTLAAPAAQRIAAAEGHHVGWTVLAYGGADLGSLLAAHPRLEPKWAAPALAFLADRLFAPIEPAAHLPHLTGRFLVLGGRGDTLIPEGSARRMRELTPEPKTIVLLEGDHMGVGAQQQPLLDRIVAVSRRWLIDQKAVAAVAGSDSS